jgi:hypothetical protein
MSTPTTTKNGSRFRNTEHYPDGDGENDEAKSTAEHNMESADSILRPERFDSNAHDHRRKANAQAVSQESAAVPGHPRAEVNQHSGESDPSGDGGYTNRLSQEC